MVMASHYKGIHLSVSLSYPIAMLYDVDRHYMNFKFIFWGYNKFQIRITG